MVKTWISLFLDENRSESDYSTVGSTMYHALPHAYDAQKENLNQKDNEGDNRKYAQHFQDIFPVLVYV